MKYIKLLALFVLLIFIADISLAETMKYGRLYVFSKYPSKNRYIVFVDEEKVGLTPIKITDIEAGEHIFRAIDDKTYKTAIDKMVVVKEGEIETIMVEDEAEGVIQKGESEGRATPPIYNKDFNISLAQYNSEKKDPGMATLFSFLITSGGQFYNGEVGKAIGFIVGDLICYYLLYKTETTYSYGYYSTYSYTTYPTATIGALGLLTLWIWSMIDANMSAADINNKLREKYGLTMSIYNNIPILQYSIKF